MSNTAGFKLVSENEISVKHIGFLVNVPTGKSFHDVLPPGQTLSLKNISARPFDIEVMIKYESGETLEYTFEEFMKLYREGRLK